MPDDAGPFSVDEQFDLTRLFAGSMRAWGVFEDRFGRIRRRFFVTMSGSWKNETFHLDESFRYDDGRLEQRTWIVVPGADGTFSATCPDCIGEARGKSSGDTIEMFYRFRLQLPSRTLDVDFHDRIYRMTDGRAVNRTTMRKWGVKLGELSLFFEPLAQRRPA